MRVTQITATVTTLILCIGDVSAYGSYNDLPRYDRRGIYNDPIYERSLGNDYDSELYERDIFSEGINLGRDLAERELYDREVAYYDRQARTPMGLGLVPRMTPTEAIGVAAACCGFLTTGIAIGAGAWYFTAKLAANKATALAKATPGLTATQLETGAIGAMDAAASMPGALVPAGHGGSGSKAMLPAGNYKLLYSQVSTSQPQVVSEYTIDAQGNCKFKSS
ncbi:hypothetical protein MMC19_000299 [Ptychographa xylographoides]|nr:hypothetical protein [Ptychographa xylographoides]